jgi:hypothetical protein
MSRKTHYKIKGVDCRAQGQSEDEFKSQSVCGFACVTVTSIKKDVDCKICKKMIEAAENSDDTYYDNTM